MIEHHASLQGSGRRFGIVVSRFNDLVTRQLLLGARDCLLRHGVDDDSIVAAWVPGAWEIPAALRRMSRGGDFDALIALGAIIRGATPHFEYVSGGVTSGISTLAASQDLPISFGVLTTDSLEQALERAGSKAGNKGWDAALAALEMVGLFDRL
jgi:6,7-dimethyl-8-ribityllumazine synthase